MVVFALLLLCEVEKHACMLVDGVHLFVKNAGIFTMKC